MHQGVCREHPRIFASTCFFEAVIPACIPDSTEFQLLLKSVIKSTRFTTLKCIYQPPPPPGGTPINFGWVRATLSFNSCPFFKVETNENGHPI